MRLTPNPVTIAAIALVAFTPLALWQASTADRPGKKLALISQRAELEQLPREEIYLRAVALKGKLSKAEEQDEIFRGATLIWLAHALSEDLAHPTLQEDAALPRAEGIEAARRLTPATGYEGGRIRALYEARTGGKEREQLPVLAQMIARSPSDDEVVRAYVSALRKGGSDERRKAIEIARDYVRRAKGSPLSRLTLLLAFSSSRNAGPSPDGKAPDPKDIAEAKALASELLKETPQDSPARETVEQLARQFAR